MPPARPCAERPQTVSFRPKPRGDVRIGVGKVRVVQSICESALHAHADTFGRLERLEDPEIPDELSRPFEMARPELPNRPLGGITKAAASNQRSMVRWPDARLPLPIRSGVGPNA
jgi:hypothetical protein